MAFCLLLKVVQSVDKRKPLCEPEEVAMVKVQVLPVEEAMEIPEAPDVAKVPPKYNVRSADKSPPPSKAPAVLMALELETALMDKLNAPVVLL